MGHNDAMNENPTPTTTASRVATDDELATWREEGWVLLEGLIGTEEIDAAADDLELLFPSVEEYFADPEGETRAPAGTPARRPGGLRLAGRGPGFRPAQQQWMGAFPFAGSGAAQPAVRPPLPRRLRRAGPREPTTSASTRPTPAAKYPGSPTTSSPCTPTATTRGSRPSADAPWWNLTGFLYLSDVTETRTPP